MNKRLNPDMASAVSVKYQSPFKNSSALSCYSQLLQTQIEKYSNNLSRLCKQAEKQSFTFLS